jgi:hypothetical protein
MAAEGLIEGCGSENENEFRKKASSKAPPSNSEG